jgi:hypothetical protein
MEWDHTFHHPHHRPTRLDVTGPKARFPIFLPATPITLSGSRRSGRFRGRVPPTALFGPLPPNRCPKDESAEPPPRCASQALPAPG